MMLFTSYPAKRHVSFELDGVNYEATVEFKDAETVQPQGSPSSRSIEASSGET